MMKCHAASLAIGMLIGMPISPLIAPLAHAQNTTRIYRCGPQGKSISQFPCDGGRPMDIHDQRTDAQHADAKQLAAAQIRQVAMLEKSNRQQPHNKVHKAIRTPAGIAQSRPSWQNKAERTVAEKYFKAVVPKAPQAAKD
jgi:hypothetical protein